MFCLPDIPGRYPVGATTFASSLHVPHTIGQSCLKESGSGTQQKPALILEETVFTAYYPADTGGENASSRSTGKRPVPSRCMNWLSRPSKESLHGYAHFGDMSYWMVHRFLGPYASRLKIPVYQNAPLLDPTKPADDPEAQWPLVLLSHGLCGTRTTYSQLCARLAAEGKVVLAMEHRDGTGPAVMPSSYSHRRAKLEKKVQPKGKYYIIPEKDIVWEDRTERDPFAFRADQLVFRNLEMYLAHSMFAELVCAPSAGDSPIFGPLYTIDGPQPDNPVDAPFWKSWVSAPSRVQCTQDVSLVGHSFGGATVLSILSNPPPTLLPEHTSIAPTRHFAALPVRYALILDPWLEPLPSPGPTPHASSAPAPQLLIINSEEFSMWKDHFARLQDVVRAWRRDVAGQGATVALLTLVRAKHVSFSDFGALTLPGRSPKAGRLLLDAVGTLALAFFAGHAEDGVRDAKLQQRKMQVEWVPRHKVVTSGGRSTEHRRLVGEVGDVIVH